MRQGDAAQVPPKLAGLLATFLPTALLHLARCERRGVAVLVTSGWRSPIEQMNLFSRGRCLNPVTGVWVVSDQAQVVTNAMPDKAPHCRGAAYDFCPLVDERPAWGRLDLFQVIADCSVGLGLTWGGSWLKIKDMPHFELPTWRDLPIKEV